MLPAGSDDDQPGCRNLRAHGGPDLLYQRINRLSVWAVAHGSYEHHQRFGRITVIQGWEGDAVANRLYSGAAREACKMAAIRFRAHESRSREAQGLDLGEYQRGHLQHQQTFGRPPRVMQYAAKQGHVLNVIHVEEKWRAARLFRRLPRNSHEYAHR